ncbi:DUF885 domain-containing protein [Brachybacterium saurashtrense]|uniref:DUF885 domain-containing protein n=1 Tax=Brachybacterium saurashtrense TaxID=556288 RepID=A0A345YNR0_9MICO|nr:DUF885 domain-containing protein [Brachybacterium saurashtrense]AXK45562.1 DUF885 domain-containing protein [Brachybacterium saurashtrense]RRR21067.1 DUF885 domain-containing protein [Brachybacterium saurashtrense]
MPDPTAVTAPRPTTALDALADEYVELSARLDPFLATSLGIPGHDHEVTDFSPAAVAERTDAARTLLARAAEVPDEDAADAVTRAALTERLGLEIERSEQHLDIATVNNLASPLQSRDELDQMPTDTAEDWQVISERMSRFPDALGSWAQSLHEAAGHGVLSARRQLLLGAEQARGFAAEDGFFASFAAGAVGDDAQRARVQEAARTAAQGYLALADELEQLAARAPERDAVGRDAYALASRTFLGSQIDVDETYAWGVEELRAIVAEQEAVARRINERAGNGAGSSVEAAKQALNADPSRVLHGTEELRAWMQDLSDRAIDELAGTHFDIPEPLRRLECRIAATGSGGIYYTGPSEDLTRPGRMWWDVPSGTTEFHTWLETTTVYHEGVPGHHLQVGTQTLQASALNRWRAMMCWVSGHGEGWALYAERLMDQLGHLADDGDRLGMLDAQRLRAGRVVLDIGLHCELPMPDSLAGSAGGAWTYEKAWDFMGAHWGVTEAERRFELHRYLGWPGQAPSYKIGQRLWEELRAEAERAGTPVRDFHRRALELGGLPLSVLEEALR